MGDFNMPDGCRISDNPAEQTSAGEALTDQMPAECPGCGFNTSPEGDEQPTAYGFAPCISVSSRHDIVAVCERENLTQRRGAPSTACNTTLVRLRCDCPDCDPNCP